MREMAPATRMRGFRNARAAPETVFVPVPKSGNQSSKGALPCNAPSNLESGNRAKPRTLPGENSRGSPFPGSKIRAMMSKRKDGFVARACASWRGEMSQVMKLPESQLNLPVIVVFNVLGDVSNKIPPNEHCTTTSVPIGNGTGIESASNTCTCRRRDGTNRCIEYSGGK